MADNKKLRRDAGIIGLLYASVGSMIGSGWLLGPLHAAQSAGALSVLSWILGAIMVMLLALVFAELVTMYPKSGALVHLSHLSHGPALGVIWSWVLILTYLPVAPGEVLAIIAYASSYIPSLTQGNTELLSTLGMFVAVGLLAIIIGLNLLAIKIVLTINSAATWWKVIVPIATIIVLLSLSFHPANLHAGGGSVSGMFTSMASAGIVYSFFGFRQAIDLAGETAKPSRTIPIAVIGSVLIAVVIYVGLQLAFLMSVDPAALGQGGWAKLEFNNMAGPFAALALAAGAGWWAFVLYIDAVISPAGAGFIWATSAGRIGMATAEMGNAPRVLARLNDNGVPWVSLIAAFVIGSIFFFPFPSWQKVIEYISAITVLSYGIGPVILLHLRRTRPDAERPFKLSLAWIIAPLAFISSNWIIIWTGLRTVSFMFGLLIALFVIYVAWFYLGKPKRDAFGWRHISWLAPYFGGLWLLDVIGPDAVNGYGLVSFGTNMGIAAVFSLAILWLALKTALSEDEVATVSKRITEMQDIGEKESV